MVHRHIEQYKTIDRDIIDPETAEIVGVQREEIKTYKSVPVSEGNYYKTYDRLYDMIDYAHRHLNYFIGYLSVKMSYASDGQVVSLNKREKENIAKKFGISLIRVEQLIKESLDAGYLIRVSRGEYSISPFLTTKGDWKNTANLQENYQKALNEVKIIGNTELLEGGNNELEG